MRKVAILLIAIATTLAFAGCGTGVTIEADSPVDIPEQVEAGGVTVHAPEQIKAGDVQIETEDGRITAK